VATARVPRQGKAPRSVRQARVMSHRARRQLAPSPDEAVAKVAAEVGRAFEAWASRFVALVVRDVVRFQFPNSERADALRQDAALSRTVPVLHGSRLVWRTDATVRQLFEEAGRATPRKEVLESAFRMVDKQSADEMRVAGVRTADVVPGLPAKQAAWVRQNTDLIRAEADLRRRVERVIADPINEGRSVKDIAKKLEEQAGYSKSRAELTARDQTLKVYGQIQEERQRAAGITKYVWSTTLDERVRPDHADLDGTVQAWDDPPIVDKRTGRRANPGLDYQCLPGDSQIGFTGSVHGAFRRWHDGQLTLIVTDTGESVECTPNHPVLTAAGWKKAQAVQVGDYVVKARLDGRIVPEAHVKHRESSVSDVFKALALAFGTSRPLVVAPQFHGDCVVDQEVDVVDVNRSLRPDVEALLAKRLGEFALPCANASGLSIGQADLVLQTQGLAAHGSVGGLRHRLALFLGRAREACDIGGATPAWLHAMTDQEAADGLARHPVELGETFDRGALALQLQAFIVREWLGVVRRSVGVPASELGAEELPERLLVDADLSRDVGPGQTLRTQLTRVVQVGGREFSGHVFNLQTEDNWYVAQRLILHNCRCTAVPVLDDDVETGGEPPPPEPVMQPTQAELDLVRRQAESEARRSQLEAEADRRIAAARAEAERQAVAQAEASRVARLEQERQASVLRAAAQARVAVATQSTPDLSRFVPAVLSRPAVAPVQVEEGGEAPRPTSVRKQRRRRR
jgi:SPP1 gp7 family putative phage head morphogenesis protein